MYNLYRCRRCLTTDPNKLKSAEKIKIISYEEMLEMASLGAKVMQPHSIQDGDLIELILKLNQLLKTRKEL